MTTMARYGRFVLNSEGQPWAGVNIEVRLEIPGQPLVQLYGNRDGTGALGNPIKTDANGYFYFHVAGGAYQVRAYVGSSASPTYEHIERYVGIGLNSEADTLSVQLTQRIVTAAGAVTVDANDSDIIVIKKTVGAATTVNLPLAASRTKAVRIVDGKGDAATNNITIVPQSGESIYATVDYQPVIDGNGGSLILTPKADGTGWF